MTGSLIDGNLTSNQFSKIPSLPVIDKKDHQFVEAGIDFVLSLYSTLCNQYTISNFLPFSSQTEQELLKAKYSA